MTDEPKPGVIGSLPRTRPHRRSSKRPAPAGAPPVDTQAQEPAKRAPAKARTANARTAKAKPTPAKPRPSTGAAGKPRASAAAAPKPRASAAAAPRPRASTPEPPTRPAPTPGLLETAVQAAAELTEIGLHAGARALRRVASRLPRP